MLRARSWPLGEGQSTPKPGLDEADRPAPRRHRSARLAATAGGALLLGVLVYLTDRSAASATMIPSVEALAGGHVFGAVGQWLPSFVHPFAFSLLTAAALAAQCTWRYGACMAWCVVNLAFEVGQHPRVSAPLGHWLQRSCGPTSLTRPLAGYFLRGTFDRGDIAAAVLGALAAAAVLWFVRLRREITHA